MRSPEAARGFWVFQKSSSGAWHPYNSPAGVGSCAPEMDASNSAWSRGGVLAWGCGIVSWELGVENCELS
jgi:hypothetical protein